MYCLSLLMLIVLASAQPPQPAARTDAAWAFNGLCLRGANVPAYNAFMHAAVAVFRIEHCIDLCRFLDVPLLVVGHADRTLNTGLLLTPCAMKRYHPLHLLHGNYTHEWVCAV